MPKRKFRESGEKRIFVVLLENLLNDGMPGISSDVYSGHAFWHLTSMTFWSRAIQVSSHLPDGMLLALAPGNIQLGWPLPHSSMSSAKIVKKARFPSIIESVLNTTVYRLPISHVLIRSYDLLCKPPVPVLVPLYQFWKTTVHTMSPITLIAYDLPYMSQVSVLVPSTIQAVQPKTRFR